jgi:hypothetical protein
MTISLLLSGENKMSIKSDMYSAAANLIEMKLELQDRIRNLPQNPRITPGPDKLAFTISLSDLDGNFSPSYHNFKVTYDMLIDFIDNLRLESIMPNLEEIVKKGYFVHLGKKELLQPDVIEQLRGILE